MNRSHGATCGTSAGNIKSISSIFHYFHSCDSICWFLNLLTQVSIIKYKVKIYNKQWSALAVGTNVLVTGGMQGMTPSRRCSQFLPTAAVSIGPSEGHNQAHQWSWWCICEERKGRVGNKKQSTAEGTPKSREGRRGEGTPWLSRHSHNNSYTGSTLFPGGTVAHEGSILTQKKSGRGKEWKR